MKRRGAGTDTGVSITCAVADVPADHRRLATLAELVCKRFGKLSAEVSIALVDDTAIRRVNRRFLDSRRVTDVISFDLSEEGTTTFELVVNVDEADRQARQRNHSVEAELALYIVHGLLHQMGYDDARAADAERMHAAEDAVLQEAGFGSVYGGHSNLRKTGQNSKRVQVRKGTTK